MLLNSEYIFFSQDRIHKYLGNITNQMIIKSNAIQKILEEEDFLFKIRGYEISEDEGSIRNANLKGRIYVTHGYNLTRKMRNIHKLCQQTYS